MPPNLPIPGSPADWLRHARSDLALAQQRHDPARLITLVQGAGITWPEDLNAAAALTEYAVASRYPGLGGEITAEEYLQAIALAQRVLNWAEHIICQPTSAN